MLQSLHLPGEVMQHQLAELSPLIGGIRKYLRISLLPLSFLMALHYQLHPENMSMSVCKTCDEFNKEGGQ